MSEYQDRIHHLKGIPFEIGYAMGQSLGPKLGANIDRYIRERVSPGTTLDAEQWRSGALPWLRNLPTRFIEEFEGLAQGAQLPLQRLAEWAYIEAILSGQCSGVILMINHQAWIARNNDTFAPGMWGYVTIREVSNRIPAISFGLEGDVFTPTGINQQRLWLHYNYLPAWDAPIEGRPALPCYAFIVEALETCRTLLELEVLLGRITRDEAMLLFAVDGKDNSFALYECGCTDFVKLEPPQVWLVGTNHCRLYPGAPAPGSAEPLSSASRSARLETLVERLIAQGGSASPVRELIQILVDGGIEKRTGPIMTAYSNVACPATGEIWYTFGGYPSASQGDWQKLAWPW